MKDFRPDSRQDFIGELVNNCLTNTVNVLVALVVTALNVFLLYALFWG